MSRVQDIDRGWKRIEAALQELNGTEVVIGIQADEPGPDTGFGMAALAATHEFGTDRAGRNHNIIIPERSFMRATFDKERGNFEEAAKRTIALIMAGTPVTTGLNRFGAFVQAKIQGTIRAGLSPALAHGTVTRKIKGVKGKAKRARARKSSKPLIDTGAMLNAIRYVVRPKEAST